jgi:hypothetical protein
MTRTEYEYRMRQGEWRKRIAEAERLRVDYGLAVKTFVDGKIELELRKGQEALSKWVVNTREEAVRDALIKLGWTPPPEPPPASGGH